MRIFSLSLFATFFSLAALVGTYPSAANRHLTAPADETVVLCMGGSSTKYHKKADCTGLNNCSTPLSRVSRAEAVTYHNRTACARCRPR